MFKIDEKDINILKILENNTRASYKEISEKLNISIGTVHNRINKLIDNEVIEKFTVKINYDKIGLNLTSLIHVKCTSDSVFDDKHIICMYEVTGEYNILLICKFKNMEELSDYTNNLFNKSNVTNVSTEIVLNKVVDNTFSINIL